MGDKLKELENKVVELFVSVSTEFGQDGAAAKIFSVLFLSPSEVSMEYLMNETGYSAATICNKTKMLVKVNLIQKKTKPGSKKVYFYTGKDSKKMIIDTFSKIIDLKIRPIQERLPPIMDEYKKNIKKSDKDRVQRLNILETYLNDIEFIEGKYKKLINELSG